MFRVLKSSQPNAVEVSKLLLKAMRVRVSTSTVETNIKDHPEYPSILAVSDSFAEWNVPNSCYFINKEEYDPSELEYPFMAHTKNNGGQFFIVHHIRDGVVIFSDELYKKSNMNEKEFLDQWSGIALHGIASPYSGEKEYRTKNILASISKLKIIALVATLLTIVIMSLNLKDFGAGNIILSILKISGLTIGMLLVMHGVGANNSFTQQLCSLGKKNNCNSILNSDAAKITPWLSWSEIGLFYFAGSLLSLWLAANTLTLLIWLNILALPYTIYSIGYQYRQKNWCLLCCGIQVILWIEFLLNLWLNTYSFFSGFSSLETKDITIFIISFIIPVLSWAIIKPILSSSTQVPHLKQQLKKFKFNKDLFNKALTSQPHYSVPDDLMPLVLGNRDAETIITMISNPFCGPCAKAHKSLDQWLSVRNDIKLKIIFTTTDHDNDEKTKVSKHAMALSLLEDSKLLENALNDWYQQGNKKYENWAKKYPVESFTEIGAVIKKQKEWCNLTEITGTPTFLINGFKLPDPYRLDDIKYLLG